MSIEEYIFPYSFCFTKVGHMPIEQYYNNSFKNSPLKWLKELSNEIIIETGYNNVIKKIKKTNNEKYNVLEVFHLLNEIYINILDYDDNGIVLNLICRGFVFNKETNIITPSIDS